MSSKRCRREGIYHAELNQGHVEVSQVRLRSRRPATEFKSLADRQNAHACRYDFDPSTSWLKGLTPATAQPQLNFSIGQRLWYLRIGP